MRDEEDDEYYEDLDETEPVKPTNQGMFFIEFSKKKLVFFTLWLIALVGRSGVKAPIVGKYIGLITINVFLCVYSYQNLQ